MNTRSPGTYKVNGVKKKFSTEEEPWNIEGAEFVSRDPKIDQEGIHPSDPRFYHDHRGHRTTRNR